MAGTLAHDPPDWMGILRTVGGEAGRWKRRDPGEVLGHLWVVCSRRAERFWVHPNPRALARKTIVLEARKQLQREQRREMYLGRHQRGPFEDLNQHTGKDTPPDLIAMRAERVAKLEEAIQRLPPGRAEIIRHLYLDRPGATVAQLARERGISSQAVGKQHRLALAELRRDVNLASVWET